MMYKFIIVIFCVVGLNATVLPKLVEVNNCKACHLDEYSKWKTSLHAKSYEKNNQLYSEVVDFVAKSVFKLRARVLYECAKCHSPRITIDDVKLDYAYAQINKIETNTTKNVHEALKSKEIRNGIACFVCHNVDNIKLKENPKDAGYNDVQWTKGDLIVGPFEHSPRSTYHGTEKRDFFRKNDDLCLVCHEGSGNYNKLPGYQFGSEVAMVEDKKRCVECHMGKLKKGFISAVEAKRGVVERDMRAHEFSGIRNSQEIRDTTVDLSITKEDDSLNLIITNLTPHKVPSGFSGRSLVIEVKYINHEKVVKTDNFTFKQTFLDRHNQETLSYIAEKLKEDTRLKPNEVRKIKLDEIKENFNKINVEVYYYVLSKQLQEKIQVKDKSFTQPYKIKSVTFSF